MKVFLKIFLLLVCVLSLIGCNKEEPETFGNEINISIKNSTEYELDLMISGDEEGATIKRQATSFQKSELIRDLSTNWSVVYKYKPLLNFTGMDFVEIETCTGGESQGCTNMEIIRINFTVSD